MHFIESWLGISPDGDSGLLEVLFFAALALIAAVVLRRTALKRPR